MDTRLSAAEAFPPGEFIRDELEARGWTQEDLARILGRPLGAVNEIIQGKKRIMPETALGLSEAFGTSPDLWLNLETAYQLSLATRSGDDGAVAKRSRLFSKLPVRELLKRRWLADVDPRDIDPAALERAVCEFLAIDSLDETPTVRFAARASRADDLVRPAQLAWVHRVRALANRMHVAEYSGGRLRTAAKELVRRSCDEENLPTLPESFARLGVRLVFVPHLSKTTIDGAALWLNAQSPVIAMSLRIARLDSFWFTLMHEAAHLVCGHGREADIVDSDLAGRNRHVDDPSGQEAAANQLAADWLLPQEQADAFVRSVTKPYFWHRDFVRFSAKLGVHWSILLGRCQHLGEVPWSHLSKRVPNVREIIERAGLMDAVPPTEIGSK